MVKYRKGGRIEEICCPWNREDVEIAAENYLNPPRKLSEDDIDYVLEDIEANFDANLGINWNTIVWAIGDKGVK